MQFLVRHTLARAAHEIAEDECTSGLGDAQCLGKSLGFGKGMYKGILGEGHVEGIVVKGTVLVRAGNDLDPSLQSKVGSTLPSEDVLFLT